MAISRAFTAGVVVAGSSYGITIGRPILQATTWHFTYAETLQFTYPVTVTLLHLVVAYVVLLCLGFFSSIYEDGLTKHVWRRTGGPKSAFSDQINTICRFGSANSLQTFALAFSFAAATFLSTYALYFAPLEISLFSRLLVIPTSIVVTRVFDRKDAVSAKAIFPAAMLCLGVMMAAYRPNTPQVPAAEWAAFVSSAFAPLWPFQLRRSFQSSERSQQKYKTLHAWKLNSPNRLTSLFILRDTVLLAVILLIPLLILSGEIGHIRRNCYFLKVPDFWVFLVSGATFRSILLISSAIFIVSTSALSFAILTVLIEVSQMVPLTYSKLLLSQWMALALCLIAGAWLYCLHRPLTAITTDASDKDCNTDKTKWSRSLSEKGPLSSLMRVATVSIFILGCTQVFIHHGSQPTTNTKLPFTYGMNNGVPMEVPKMLTGNDAYLGQRPQADLIANFSILVEECRGTYDHLENINNVHRCLDFLSTKQNTYLIAQIPIPRHLKAGAHVQIESNSVARNSFGDIARTSRSEKEIDTCEGQIIPYHIWWTGLPTWRIELFIKSYFYTQNLPCSRLWIWVNTDYHPGALDDWFRHSRFQRFMPLVSSGDIILNEWKLPSRVPLPPHLDELDLARYYDRPGKPNAQGERFVADSIIRDSAGQDWVQIYEDGDTPQLTYHTIGVSDAARLIILHLHGGVYMDPDILLLRDLRPLLLTGRGFAARWGTTRDPSAYNNALLCIPANSTISSYLLLGGTRMKLAYHFLSLSRMLVQEHRDDKDFNDERSLLKLENAFFDPIWVENDGKRIGRCSVPCVLRFEHLFKSAPIAGEWDSFDGHRNEEHIGTLDGSEKNEKGVVTVNRTLENFYQGAYAVHLHNLWSMQFELGSWIDVVACAHDGFFRGQRTNAYGERWERPEIAGYLGGFHRFRDISKAGAK